MVCWIEEWNEKYAKIDAMNENSFLFIGIHSVFVIEIYLFNVIFDKQIIADEKHTNINSICISIPISIFN